MRLPKSDFATFVFTGNQPLAQESGWLKRLLRKSLDWLLMVVLLSSIMGTYLRGPLLKMLHSPALLRRPGELIRAQSQLV